MRIGQTTSIVFVSKVASSAIGFVATVVFARILGAEVLGYYALALVIVKWLKLGGDVGIASAVTKRMSEGDAPSAYFAAGLVSVAFLGVVCSVAVLVFRDVVNQYVGVDVAMFVVLLVVVGLFTSIVTAALQGDHLVHVSGLLSPVRKVARSLLQVGLVLAGFGLAGMLVGYAIGGLLVGLIGLWALSVGIAWPRLGHFRSLFEFAKFSWLGNLKARSFNDIDLLVLGALVSPTLVGVYSIAWNITGFIGTFGSSIRQTTFPELSKADANERNRRIGNIVTDSLAYNGLFAIPGLFGALVVGDRLLFIYGREFTRGTAVLGLLILAMLIYDYKSQLLTALNAIDRPDLSFRVNAVFVAVNLALNVVFVTLIGWAGAAVATVISTVVGLGLAFYYLSLFLEFTVPVAEFGRQLLAALCMALVVFVARSAVESAGLTDINAVLLVVLVSLGVGTYFGIMWVISARFRSTVDENAPVPVPFRS